MNLYSINKILESTSLKPCMSQKEHFWKAACLSGAKPICAGRIFYFTEEEKEEIVRRINEWVAKHPKYRKVTE